MSPLNAPSCPTSALVRAWFRQKLHELIIGLVSPVVAILVYLLMNYLFERQAAYLPAAPHQSMLSFDNGWALWTGLVAGAATVAIQWINLSWAPRRHHRRR